MSNVVTTIKNVILVIQLIVLVALCIVIVIKIDTSMSNTRNIRTTITKLVEKLVFLALMFMNPHSNLIFSSFFSKFFSFNIQNVIVKAMVISTLSRVIIIDEIDFYFFNWKLNVNLILFSLFTFLINKLIYIGIAILHLRSVNIRLLFRMSCDVYLILLFLLCLLL